MAKIIGRTKEIKELQELYKSDKAEIPHVQDSLQPSKVFGTPGLAIETISC